MQTVCPHCHAEVEVTRRGGLRGALCPACHELIEDLGPAGGEGPAQDAGRSRRRFTEVLDVGRTCPACDVPRDPAMRRCPSCGERWTLQIVALAFTRPDAEPRLVDYIMHRQTSPEPRDRVSTRMKKLPAVVLSGLTPVAARRAWQELEGIGVRAAAEPDADAGYDGPLVSIERLKWFAVPAVALLAVGLWLNLRLDGPLEDAFAPEDRLDAAVAKLDAAPPPKAAAPVAALLGVVPVVGDTGSGLGFFVDLDGWLVAPVRMVDELGGITVVLGDRRVRAGLVRRPGGQGSFGLFKMESTAPFALKLGDAGALEVGSPVFVARPRPGGGRPDLVAERIAAVGHRVGPNAWLVLDAAHGADAHGAAVLTPDGSLVGVVDAPASEEGRRPVALPVNLLADGEGAILTEIRAARTPSAVVNRWQAAAREADRAEKAPLYEAVERKLLVSVRCEATRCRGRIGRIHTGPDAPDEALPVEWRFLAPDQLSDTPSPAFGKRTQPVGGPRTWIEEAVDASELLYDLPVPVARRFRAREMPRARVYSAEFEIIPPETVRGRRFRLVAAAGGRRSAGTLVEGEAATPSPAPSVVVPRADQAAVRFGPFTGAEWRTRFRGLRTRVADVETRVAVLERRAGEGGAVESVLEQERSQLSTLRERLSKLEAEADLHDLPRSLRR